LVQLAARELTELWTPKTASGKSGRAKSYSIDSNNINEFKGYSVICTEKDAPKLWPKWPHAFAVPLLLKLEPAFLAQLDEWLNNRLPAKLSSPDGHSTT